MAFQAVGGTIERTRHDAAEDAELVRAAQAGDLRAFEGLVERYFGMVFAMAYARMADRDMAEDLVQEVFLRIYLNLGQLDHPEYFCAWAGRLTRNLAIDWLRRGQRASRLLPMVSIEETGWEAENAMGPELRGEIERRQQDEIVRAAIWKLPVEQREMVLLHYAEDWTLEEIAERLERHPTTIGRQLKQTLKSLRGTLEPVLRGGARSLRARPAMAVRTVAVVAAAAAMPTSAKAALVAAGAVVNVSASVSAKHGAVMSAAGFIGITKNIMAATAAGVKAMGMAKGIAAGAVIIAAGFGGYTYYDSTMHPGGLGKGSGAGMSANVPKPAAKGPETFSSGGKVEGYWLGTLKNVPQQGDLRIGFNIRREAGGSYSATLDSPDQGSMGIPVDEVAVSGDSIKMSSPILHGGFEGKRTGDDEITGKWSQGAPMDLIVKRTDQIPTVATSGVHNEVPVDPSIFDQYAGQYALGPQRSLVVTRDGDKLMAQLSGQPSIQIYPESDTKFFYKVVDAQITFEKDASGVVDKLKLDQGKVHLEGKKIK